MQKKLYNIQGQIEEIYKSHILFNELFLKTDWHNSHWRYCLTRNAYGPEHSSSAFLYDSKMKAKIIKSHIPLKKNCDINKKSKYGTVLDKLLKIVIYINVKSW